jgi:hypothetical protein
MKKKTKIKHVRTPDEIVQALIICLAGIVKDYVKVSKKRKKENDSYGGTD